jgi:hypothetical protein
MLCVLSLINSFMEQFYQSVVTTIFHHAFLIRVPRVSVSALLNIWNMLPSIGVPPGSMCILHALEDHIVFFFLAYFSISPLQNDIFHSYINSLFPYFSSRGTSKEIWHWLQRNGKHLRCHQVAWRVHTHTSNCACKHTNTGNICTRSVLWQIKLKLCL